MWALEGRPPGLRKGEHGGSVIAEVTPSVHCHFRKHYSQEDFEKEDTAQGSLKL